jgi:hypothetical protein
MPTHAHYISDGVLDIMMTKAMNRKKGIQWGLYDKTGRSKLC